MNNGVPTYFRVYLNDFQAISYLLVMAFCILCILPTQSLAGVPEFWMLQPEGWASNPGDGELVRQYVEPRQNAFVEIYAMTGENPGIRYIADGWEQGMQSRGMPYVSNKLSELSSTVEGEAAIKREYSGDYSGMPIRSVITYAYAKGTAFVIVGVWAESSLEQTVRTSTESFRLSPPSVPTTAPHKTPPAPAPKATTATSAPPRPTTKSFTLPDPAVYFPGDMEVRADWQQDGILDDLPEEKVEGVGTYRMAYAVYAPFDLPPGQSDLSVEVRIFTGAPAVISALYNTKSDALPSAAQPSPFSGHWLVERLDTGGKSFWITTGSVLINVSGTPEQEAINILKLVRSKVISGEPT